MLGGVYNAQVGRMATFPQIYCRKIKSDPCGRLTLCVYIATLDPKPPSYFCYSLVCIGNNRQEWRSGKKAWKHLLLHEEHQVDMK